MAEANKDILDLIAAVKSGNAQALKDRSLGMIVGFPSFSIVIPSVE